MSYAAYALTNGNDEVARGQLRLFDELGTQASLPPDERRRLLSLSESEWAAWDRFLRDGPMPAWPRLPEMLMRVGSAAHRITTAMDCMRVPAGVMG